MKLSGEIFEIFSEYEDINGIYLCGGYIRNKLISGRGGKDIDLFIDCTRKQLGGLTEYLKRYGRIDYGQYGSPRFFPKSSTEQYVDLVPFYNFVVSPSPINTIEDLLTNFDFTANAIGINLKTGEFHDPLNGREDIRNRVLRAVRLDFPERPVSDMINFSAVSVFWFRLLHYQKILGFNFDSITERWIMENAFRIKDKDNFRKHFFNPDIDETMKIKIEKCLHQ